MNTISEFTGQILQFSQLSFFKRSYELKANNELIGTFQQKGFFSHSIDISLFNKKWEFYRPSFWKSEICIREAGHELPFAFYRNVLFKNRGTIELPKGERLNVVFYLFKSKYEIQTEQGVCLVQIKPRFSLLDKAEVLIEKKSELLDKYPWVIMLAYSEALDRRHRAAGAA